MKERLVTNAGTGILFWNESIRDRNWETLFSVSSESNQHKMFFIWISYVYEYGHKHELEETLAIKGQEV